MRREAGGAASDGPGTRASGIPFGQPTSLSHEHSRLMRTGHREVRWGESSAGSLPEPLRRQLGELWQARAVSEHRSIGIFALFTLDLLGAGAPAELLSHACRAQLDEVRHAELFARLAQLYTGVDASPPPGIPAMPDDESIPLADQVIQEALYLCVFAETYSSVLLTAIYEQATDITVKDALGVVIADEIHHARLGWACISTMLGDREGMKDRLAELVLPTMDSLVGALFGDPRQLPPPGISPEDRAVARAHGYMTPHEEWALFRDTIRDAWVPGLRRLGIDAGSLLARYGA